ncbi:MAG: glycosyltransferase family 2 protein [bacterium]
MSAVSIIIPAYNEEKGIGKVLDDLCKNMEKSGLEYEIIVVNDGSVDQTAAEIKKFPVTLMNNIHNSGYGFSIRRGIKSAKEEYVAIIDADGSYPCRDIPRLVGIIEMGYDMVVGARQGKNYWSSPLKSFARIIFKLLAEYTAGRKIGDINSGLRIMRRDKVIPFLPLTCTTFSFTTSLTLIMMLNGLFVTYVPIEYYSRKGYSKVKLFRDTLRAGQVIVEAIILYNPLKLYLLISIFLFLLSLINFVLFIFWPYSHFWVSACIGLFSSTIVFSLGLLSTSFKK